MRSASFCQLFHAAGKRWPLTQFKATPLKDAFGRKQLGRLLRFQAGRLETAPSALGVGSSCTSAESESAEAIAGGGFGVGLELEPGDTAVLRLGRLGDIVSGGIVGGGFVGGGIVGGALRDTILLLSAKSHGVQLVVQVSRLMLIIALRDRL